LANIYASVTAAIGALSGPLHGGANTNVMKTLLEIATSKIWRASSTALAENERSWVRSRSVSHRRSRATHLRKFSKEMGERAGDTKVVRDVAQLEEVMMREKGALSER